MRYGLLPAALLIAAAIQFDQSSNAPDLDLGPAFTNSIGMRMIRIEPGTFRMGSEDGDLDERPVHTVALTQPYYVGAYEVTNAQYERFDPDHRALRGKLGFSTEDDEAVVFVSWHDAVAFTEWLSEQEGRPYRLPTEAEWEYAARAGTTTPYHTGAELPASALKNARVSWFPDTSNATPEDVVPLTVGQAVPNPWGLFDVHGNVEEWTHDWYGPYEPGASVDPVGRADGDFKVTRGGSHSTLPYYLRAANRMGTLPEDRSWLIGFRVVLGAASETAPLPPPAPPLHQRDVSQEAPPGVADGPDPEVPYAAQPLPYIRLTPTDDGPFYYHNHQPAVSELPNGDLMAIWYTTKSETGRYLAQAASRLRYGAAAWEPASIFWDAPDRNDHGNALWWDGDRTLHHVSGLAAAATWGSLALVHRTSTDNGATWSRPRIVAPEHGLRNQVIASMGRTQDGAIYVTADAVTGGNGGTALHLSRDGGETWTDPGGTIAGIHASAAELSDGRLLAFGRGDPIDGRMPKSLSDDQGQTWTHEASDFPPIRSTQRLVLIRLQDGPLFFASFADNMAFEAADGSTYHGSGLFGALSYDDGATWPVRRLITDDRAEPHWMTTARSRPFLMSPYTAEPRGYMAVTQSRDGRIHLISSVYHYAFNAAWLETPPPPPDPAVLPARADLAVRFDGRSLPSEAPAPGRFQYRGAGTTEAGVAEADSGDGAALRLRVPDGAEAYWRNDAADGFSAVRPGTGGTAEIRVRVTRSGASNRGVDLFMRLDDERYGYHISITPDAVWSFDAFALEPLAQDLDHASAAHTFRLAVGADGLMRVYRDGALLGRWSPALFWDEDVPGGSGSYLLWGAGEGVEAEVTYVAYDTQGGYRPE